MAIGSVETTEIEMFDLIFRNFEAAERTLQGIKKRIQSHCSFCSDCAHEECSAWNILELIRQYEEDGVRKESRAVRKIEIYKLDNGRGVVKLFSLDSEAKRMTYRRTWFINEEILKGILRKIYEFIGPPLSEH